MIKTKKAESLTTVIVWVVILAFITLTLSTIIINSQKEQKLFENHRFLKILRNNTANVVSKLDTDNIWENSDFYIYKNTITKNFEVFTWSNDPADASYVNHKYKYINKDWEKVSINYDWNIYQRYLWLEREDTSIQWEKNQIIKAVVKKLIKKY
jgi:hypothetical protein